MTEKKKRKGLAFIKTDSNVFRLLIVLLLIFAFGCIVKPGSFLKPGNFQTIGKQLSEYGLMALGVGLCMISGGIDLSSVYVANLCGIAAALFMQRMAAVEGANVALIIAAAILLALAIGTLCGAFNGFLVAQMKVPAMLATLGTYQLYMGIAIVISKGSTVSGIPKVFTKLGTGMLFKAIPYSFIVFFVVVVLLCLLMKYSKLGTRIYLVGTNGKSSEFAGINNKAVLIKTYMLSGLVAALAGLLSLSRLNSAKADFGSSYTMQCILISVLGGVNPNGGFGTVPGIAIAVIILQMLSSLLNMFPNISNYYRDFIWGAALITILIVNKLADARKMKRLQKAA